MNTQQLLITIGLSAVSYFFGLWTEKIRSIDKRRAYWEELRIPIYAEATKFLHDIDMNWDSITDLQADIWELRDWIMRRTNYLPSLGSEVISKLMWDGVMLNVAMNARSADATNKLREMFLASLKTARSFFASNQDIRCLPEDRKGEK